MPGGYAATTTASLARLSENTGIWSVDWSGFLPDVIIAIITGLVIAFAFAFGGRLATAARHRAAVEAKAGLTTMFRDYAMALLLHSRDDDCHSGWFWLVPFSVPDNGSDTPRGTEEPRREITSHRGFFTMSG